MSFDPIELINKKVVDLRILAKELDIKGILKLSKSDLVEAIIATDEKNQKHKSENNLEESLKVTPKTTKVKIKKHSEESSEMKDISSKSGLTIDVNNKVKKVENTDNQPNELTSDTPLNTNGNQQVKKTSQSTSPLQKDKVLTHPQVINSNEVTVPLPPSAYVNQNKSFAVSKASVKVDEKPIGIVTDNSTNIPLQPPKDANTVAVEGVLDLNGHKDNAHGILRSQKLVPSDKDTYISLSQVKKFRLKKGDYIKGLARMPKENERYFSLLWINEINGMKADDKLLFNRPKFEDFKPIYPDKQLVLETDQHTISTRFIDILAPIGYGQRSMVVAQPKSGKTFILKDIAKGINTNYPEIQLMVVLIGERPEEVTDIERSVNGLVYASNFDEDPQSQVTVAELALERAKRMVELGKDVVILMDSLTRLARAYNVALPASGRTLSGGLDPASLYPSKKFFGAARNFENGASLTIVATALVDTGSKMDDVIFEEFKGTGNNELYLDRRLADNRIFPALNWSKSGTRNEELLLGQDKLHSSWRIRKLLGQLGDDGVPALIDKLKTTKNNQHFLDTISS